MFQADPLATSLGELGTLGKWQSDGTKSWTVSLLDAVGLPYDTSQVGTRDVTGSAHVGLHCTLTMNPVHEPAAPCGETLVKGRPGL